MDLHFQRWSSPNSIWPLLQGWHSSIRPQAVAQFPMEPCRLQTQPFQGCSVARLQTPNQRSPRPPHSTTSDSLRTMLGQARTRSELRSIPVDERPETGIAKPPSLWLVSTLQHCARCTADARLRPDIHASLLDLTARPRRIVALVMWNTVKRHFSPSRETTQNLRPPGPEHRRSKL